MTEDEFNAEIAGLTEPAPEPPAVQQIAEAYMALYPDGMPEPS